MAEAWHVGGTKRRWLDWVSQAGQRSPGQCDESVPEHAASQPGEGGEKLALLPERELRHGGP